MVMVEFRGAVSVVKAGKGKKKYKDEVSRTSVMDPKGVAESGGQKQSRKERNVEAVKADDGEVEARSNRNCDDDGGGNGKRV